MPKPITPQKSPINLQIHLNFLFLGLICFLLFQNYFHRNKTAYIDSNKVYSGYKGIVIAKKEFEKKVELYKTRIDTLSGRVKLDMLNMEKFRSSQGLYALYRDSIGIHKKQLYDYQSAINQSLKEEEAKLTKTALMKLNTFLKEYGKKNGYDMILIANNSGTIAYAKDQYDITEDVLKDINKQYE